MSQRIVELLRATATSLDSAPTDAQPTLRRRAADLVSLYNLVIGADAAPTRQMEDAFAALSAPPRSE